VASSPDALDGERFGVVVDATGVPAVIEKSIPLVQRGGRALVFGVAPSEATIAVSPFRIYNDEVTVIGSMAVLHSFGRALKLVADGSVRTAELLAAPMPLASYADALHLVRRGQGIKTQLAP